MFVCCFFFLLLTFFFCMFLQNKKKQPRIQWHTALQICCSKKSFLLFLTIIPVTACFIKNMKVNKQEFTHNLAIQRYKAGLNKQSLCFCVLRQKELYTREGPRGSGCAKI